MSVEFSYRLRKDEAGTTLRDLDDVVVLASVVTDDGTVITAGTEGTVVGVWNDGEAFIVEFAEPEGALATVRADGLRRTGRHAP